MKKAKKKITLDILARMMADGFGRVEVLLLEVDKRFKKIEARLDKIEERLDKIEDRLAKVEIRLDKIEVRLDKIEARLDGLESELRAFKAETRAAFEALESRVFPNPIDREDLEARVSYIEKKLKIKSGR